MFARLAGRVSLPTQWLRASGVGATRYVAPTAVMMTRSTMAHMRAQAEDDGAATLLALLLLGAVASLGAIVWELAGAKSPGNGHALLSVVQVGYAFVIGMTSQTADIGLSATAMRRLVMIHGMVAFLFNTTLLALTVNVAATLLA